MQPNFRGTTIVTKLMCDKQVAAVILRPYIQVTSESSRCLVASAGIEHIVRFKREYTFHSNFPPCSSFFDKVA